ncbi:hypothetical protein [Bradyrhizobium valentinum]|nr:hypothetical protein [Bradyrhizobium valentinum]
MTAGSTRVVALPIGMPVFSKVERYLGLSADECFQQQAGAVIVSG